MPSDQKRDDRAVQREMRDAVRREPFVQGGVSQLVKVVSISDVPASRLNNAHYVFPVTGFVTLERFLLGDTPEQIEQNLGVRHHQLHAGCLVFGLQRQPGPTEIDYELTAEYPDGVAFTVLSSQDYPPGDTRIHQWRLLVSIPGVLLCRLTPGMRYQSSARP